MFIVAKTFIFLICLWLILQLATTQEVDYDNGATREEELTYGANVELPADCGQVHTPVRRLLRRQKWRINSGYDAKPGQFPSYVHLLIKKTGGDFQLNIEACGGTIITSQHILTAAHCLNNATGADGIDVGPGVISLIVPYPGRETYKVDRVCKSSKFRDLTDLSKPMIYDVAILKLTKPIPFDDNVQPACLPANNEPLPVQSQQAYAVGMGNQAWAPQIPQAQLALSLQVLPVMREECRKGMGEHETVLCIRANDPKHRGIVCAGDSGGPLLAADARGRQTVYGVASFGPSNCLPLDILPANFSSGWFADTHQLRQEIEQLLEECA